MINLGSLAKSLGKGRGTGRRDHELLNVHAGIRVGTSVENVHHGDRQYVRVGPADIPEEWKIGRQGRGASHREGDTQNGVRSQSRLVGRRIEVEHRRIHASLIGRFEPE